MNEIIIYNTEDGKSKINLKLENGTVWLNQLQIAELFQTTKQNISKHINAIFKDNELDSSTVNYQLTVQNEGGRNIERNVAYYNLDMILAIGYRVRSPRGVQFRIYALVKKSFIGSFLICLQHQLIIIKTLLKLSSFLLLSKTKCITLYIIILQVNLYIIALTAKKILWALPHSKVINQL